MDSSSPPILRLPTEIISNVLSLVVPSGLRPEQGLLRLDNKSGKLHLSPFHVVRSTCRTFRWIVDELPFWRDDKFSMADIELYRRPHWTSRNPSPDARRDVNVLLSDPHLCQVLYRKTGWTVNNPLTFRELIRRIPHFGQCVHRLQLSTYDVGQSAVYIYDPLLNSFPKLTTLEFRSAYHLDFDVLPPSLQTLFLSSRITCDSGCTNDLPNLERLYYVLPHDMTPLDFKRMLPFNSKNTLRELQFKAPIVNFTPTPDFTLLNQFKSLTSLQIHASRVGPIELFQSFSHAPFRLKSFEATAPRISPVNAIETLVRLLQSPTLRNLSFLHIVFSYTEDIDLAHRPVYEQLIEAIVNLPDLEDLHLKHYLFHPDWIQLFRKSRRLRTVRWEYFRFSPLEVVGRYRDDDSNSTLRDILSGSPDEVVEVSFECRDSFRDIPSDDEFDDEEDDNEDYYSEYDDYSEYDYYEGDDHEEDDDEEDDDEEDDDEGYEVYNEAPTVENILALADHDADLS